MSGRRIYLAPVSSAALLIIAVTAWLAFQIPKGVLTYPDELLTAERSREMLLKGRATVQFNFRPSFAKPPLQYWLTTFILPRIANSSTAVRIWPLACGVLSAIALGCLAFLVAPDRPWLIPLAVAIYVSCPLFSTEAIRALLDTGLVFFTTLAIGFAQLARRNAIWWLAVAIACWLGALQKIPLILLVWAIIIAVRFFDMKERANLRNIWLVGSGILSVALIAIWPVFQNLHYHMPLLRAFAGDDPSALFGERHLGARPYFEIFDGLVASGWAGGIFALFAAFAAIIAKHRNVPAREMSILAFAVVALALVFNFRSVRYVLPIIPCLSVVLALSLSDIAQRNNQNRVRTIVFAGIFVIAGFVQAFIKMHHRGPDASAEQRVARTLGSMQGKGIETILVEPSQRKRDLRSNAFYLFHGDMKFPLKRRNIEELREAGPPRPAVGVCSASDQSAVKELYRDVDFVVMDGRIVCWRTGAAR